MVMTFRPINQLAKLATSAGIPYLQEHQLEFGLALIRGTRDFEKGLGESNGIPWRGRIWTGFKRHFKNAQEELKQIRGPTMQQADYHHANMLAN